MSVKKEPSGRRSVRVEVEVPGTPEQVWRAIATGPGISSWFVPTTMEGRVGGALACDFGGGMVSGAKITAWQPPHRFVAEDTTWLQGGPPVATEWTVEARSGGTCVVRVVHSLFASTDQWDDQIGSTEHGWPGYFRVLRHYLAHHAGEPSAAMVLSQPVAGTSAETWRTLQRAFGTDDARIGQRLRAAAPGGAAIAGAVEAIDHVPQGDGMMMVVQDPAPGVLLVSAMDCMGMRLATMQAFYYGARADAAVLEKEHWQRWLAELFPAAAAPQGAPPAQEQSGSSTA
jgi:uncharacterized protein YndB with AHSA1/START domain